MGKLSNCCIARVSVWFYTVINVVVYSYLLNGPWRSSSGWDFHFFSRGQLLGGVLLILIILKNRILIIVYSK